MFKKTSKLFLALGVILFIMVVGGCSSDNKDDKLVINSYESSKIMPSTIFEIEMQREYLLEENYAIIVKCGHLLNANDSEKNINNIAMFQVHYFEDENNRSMNFDELISGTRIFEIKNFYSTEYKAFSEIKNGEKIIEFSREMNIKIPKEVILNESGLIGLSLTTFYLDENNRIISSNYEGSIVYLKYTVKENKIIFENK